MSEPRTEWRTRYAVAHSTARRAGVSGAIWGLVFGLLLANEALGYRSNFPTVGSRAAFARSFGENGALTAITGPARHLDTIEGFVSWRMFFLMIVIGGMWGLLTATRLLRGEEDAGRWELMLAGRATRRSATLQSLGGLAVGLLAMVTVAAACLVPAGRVSRVGFSVADSVFYAVAGGAAAAIFLAVGALTSQLVATRRGASAIGGLVFGVAFVLRTVADSGDSVAWLRWLTPLGWVDNLAPLTSPQPWVLAPIALLVAACGALAVVLSGRRDVGAGVLTRDRAPREHTRWLRSPWGLSVRLERWVVAAWVAGVGSLALVFGLVAGAAASGDLGDTAVNQTVARLGGRYTGAAAWIGYEFLYLAAGVAFAAVGQVAALRAEEGEGRLDHLVARPVARWRWLAGRVTLALACVLGAGLAAGSAAWLALGDQPGTGLDRMLQAGLNLSVPALFVLGVGILLYGVAPRLAIPALNLLIAWSFLVQLVGSTLTTNRWLIDSAVLSHIRPAPAAAPDWGAAGWMLGIAVVATALGFTAFGRRDLTGA